MSEKRKNFSTSVKKQVWDKTDGRCWYCGKRLTPFNFHVDHQEPLSRDGTNDIENLVASCSECNHEKSNKEPMIWWFESLARYGQDYPVVLFRMACSENLDINDLIVPVVFYGNRNREVCNSGKVYIKYKGWSE